MHEASNIDHLIDRSYLFRHQHPEAKRQITTDEIDEMWSFIKLNSLWVCADIHYQSVGSICREVLKVFIWKDNFRRSVSIVVHCVSKQWTGSLFFKVDSASNLQSSDLASIHRASVCTQRVSLIDIMKFLSVNWLWIPSFRLLWKIANYFFLRSLPK